VNEQQNAESPMAYDVGPRDAEGWKLHDDGTRVHRYGCTIHDGDGCDGHCGPIPAEPEPADPWAPVTVNPDEAQEDLEDFHRQAQGGGWETLHSPDDSHLPTAESAAPSCDDDLDVDL
jgi:hypothetical protein